MLVNEDRNGPGLSGSASQGVSLPSQVAGIAADLNRRPPQPMVYPKSDQEVSRDGPLGERRRRPPLKLTGHRLLVLTTMILWGVTAIAVDFSYPDRVPPIAATSVDLFVVLSGVGLYLIYERKPGKYWERFFRVDLAPDRDQCTICIGRLVLILFIDVCVYVHISKAESQ
ncbi:hypothetical protein EDB84DRAFT_1516688 [Lactarius hengduanensis]|nr:hypothetical protein EDB84DRAFT_1516688 [Lactarius hengduanensis]